MQLCLIKNKQISVIHIEIHSNIFFKHGHMADKNGDVPDLATSLYHMAHYNSINHKF